MDEAANHTFLLRVWKEVEHGHPPAFRAALTDISTRETRYFADAEALARHFVALQDAKREPDG